MEHEKHPSGRTLAEMIEAGVVNLERGDYIEITDDELDAFLDSLVATKRL